MYDVAHEHAYKMYFSYLPQRIENENTVPQIPVDCAGRKTTKK